METQFVTSYRACQVLYNFLRSNEIHGRVLLPANICSDVVLTLQKASVDLKFIDVSSKTFCIDEEMVMSEVESASALLFVHTYGVEIKLDDFFAQLKKKNPNIIIIDDKCLCAPDMGAVSAFADLTLFSCGPKKYVDLGEGGFGIIRSGWKYSNCVDVTGFLQNKMWRYDDDKINSHLIEVTMHKEKLNRIYRRYLPKEWQMAEAYQNWRFNILVDDKKTVLKKLFDNGLFASNHYQVLNDSCVVANELYDHVVNLFNDFYYSEQQAYKTCDLLTQ